MAKFNLLLTRPPRSSEAAVHTLSPQQFGTAVHVTVKNQIDALKDAYLKAEVSFLKDLRKTTALRIRCLTIEAGAKTMRHFWTHACFIAVVGASINSSDFARATSVAVSRTGEGIVCNGWAVDADIVATAAHCILRPGHFSISTGTKVYHALRSWIHPEYSTEWLFHSSLGKGELIPDLALLRIIQKDFVAGGEKTDQSNGRKLPQSSILYAVRPVVSNRTDSDRRNIEEIEYDSIQHKDHGMLISNGGKPYPICQDDSGTPLYAGVGNERTVVGVIVGNRRQYKGRSAALCGNELHVITASAVVKFVDFVRAYREGQPTVDAAISAHTSLAKLDARPAE